MNPTVSPPGLLPSPCELEIQEFQSYDLIIDARSQHEFEEDHVPGAINLPVVDDLQYAEVGTRHRSDPHAAYLIGVEYSLHNIATHIRPLIAKYDKSARMLVYCFRGGKRSKLWADNLRTIGFEVDVLRGGWKSYRRWVRASLAAVPQALDLRVLAGPTGTGKTRLLRGLADIGEQVLNLEQLASHRGSLIGGIPGVTQPTQKYFDTLVLDALREFETTRPVWLEAESKRIGNVQLPDALYEAMHRTRPIHVDAPMPERVKLWREDYPHLAANPQHMVGILAALKPIIGGAELDAWETLAANGSVDELFERIMRMHYDPCYARSTARTYKRSGSIERHFHVDALDASSLRDTAVQLVKRFGSEPDAS